MILENNPSQDWCELITVNKPQPVNTIHCTLPKFFKFVSCTQSDSERQVEFKTHLYCFVGTVVSSDPAITCMLDDDDTNDELGRCLRMGSDYVEGYLNSMKPGKKKKDFDRCG